MAEAFRIIYWQRPELRTRFIVKDGKPLQYIDDTRDFKVDVCLMDEDAKNLYLKEGYLMPFNLFEDILFRVKIIQTEECNILVVQVHHIIADGITFASLIGKRDLPLAYSQSQISPQEYGQIYHSQIEGNENHSQQYAIGRDYFIGKYKNFRPTSLVPLASEDVVGNVISCSLFLPGGSIKEWLHVKGIKSETLFMSAFAYVISAFSGDSTVVFASLNSGRFVRKIRNSYGMYVNTMPIKVQIDVDMPFFSLVKELESEVFDDIQYRHYPYYDFCSETGFRAPLVFNYRGEFITDELIIGGESFKSVFLPKGSTCSNLTLNVIQDESTYEIRIEANDSKYTSEYIATFANSIKCAVNSIVNDDVITVSDIEILTEEDKEKVMSFSYGGHRELDRKVTVVDKILSQSRKCPTAVAIRDVERDVSYAQLDELSNHLAKQLLYYGLRPGDFVCVLLNRRASFPISVLAILRSGGVYIPIDATYPEERVDYVVNDSTARLIITSHDVISPKYARRMESMGLKVFYVDEKLVCSEEKEESSCDINLSDQNGMAYMIYTSGTTGKPKGALCSHIGLLNFVEAVRDFTHLTSDDRISGHRSFSFDAHIEDMFPILTIGGCFCIMPENIRMDLPAIREYIISNKITGGGYSTAFAKLLLNAYNDLPLRFITGGGEKMTDVSSDHVEIINVYGPTECTDDTSYYKILPGLKLRDIPIGRPIFNSWSFVVNRFRKLQPLGIDGELCIAGMPVGKGYWNAEKQTKEKFVDCPFCEGNVNVMYMTGDICHWKDDGNLEYVRRIDNQINLHGYRIEAEEVEKAIISCRHIETAAVCLKKINGKERLCAYYTADRDVDSSLVNKHISGKLPEYMLPEKYIQLKTMPLSVNGKVDKSALPIPVENKTVSDSDFSHIDGNERIVIHGFREILKLKEDIGVNDSFIELGGDSISAISLYSWLVTHGFKATVSNILRMKTPRLIAQSMVLLDRDSNRQHKGLVPITPVVEYFTNKYGTEMLSDNQMMLLKANKCIEDDKIKEIFRRLLELHPMLRSVWNGGQLAVYDEYSIDDIIFYSDISIEKDILNDISKREREKFDVGCTLVKVIVYNLPDIQTEVSASYLALIINHLIVDAVSWHTILEDINLISSNTIGDDSNLRSSSNDYYDYANACEKYTHTEQFNKSINHWRCLDCHIDEQKYDINCDEGDYVVEFSLSPANTVLLQTKCNNPFSTNTGDLVVTAVAQAYATVFNRGEVGILLESHGRTLDYLDKLDLTRAVGWMTVFYPICIPQIEFDIQHDICCVKELSRREYRYCDSYLQYLTDRLKKGEKAYIPSIKVNYLGNFDNIRRDDDFWSVDKIFSTRQRRNEVGSTHLNVNVVIKSGRLCVQLFSRGGVGVHREVDKMLNEIKTRLENIINFTVCSPYVATPYDCGEMDWSIEEFKRVEAEYGRIGLKIKHISPLTHIQESFLYNYINEPASKAYRIFQCYRISYVPPKDEICKAAAITLSRHPILNANVIYKGVSSYRLVITDKKPSIEFFDGHFTSEDCLKSYLDSIYHALSEKTLDIERDYLFRTFAIKLNDSSCIIGFFVHHIVCDGWSSGIVARDFFSCLNNEIQGSNHSFDNDRYEDYVRELCMKDMESGIKYWNNLLNGYMNIATISTLGDDIHDNISEKDIPVSFKLSPHMTNKLRQRAIEANSTFSNLIELSWGLVLQIFTAQDDVVFGEVVSGRGDYSNKFKDTVGPFINTVPVRFSASGEESIDQMLEKLQQRAALSRQWDFIPMSSIIRSMDMKENPMKTVISFDNFHDMNTIGQHEPYSFDVVPTYYNSSNYTDLSLLLFVLNGELNVRFSYDRQKYPHGVIVSVAKTMERVLCCLSDSKVRNLSDVEYVGTEEHSVLMKYGEGGRLDLDVLSTVSRDISNVAIEYGDKIAVVASNGTLTYRQLLGRSNVLAKIIRSNRTGASDFVLVYLDRTWEFLVSVLGIMKSGMAYVPIAQDYPLERVRKILKHSGSNLILTTGQVMTSDMESIASEYGIRILYLDKILFENAEQCSPYDYSEPSSVAYMIYTSGTTQEPKGVMVTNAGLYNFISSAVHLEKLSNVDRISAYRSFSFDAHILDIYPVLMVGGTLFIMPSSIRKDIIKMHQYIIDNGITGCGFTTPVTTLLINTFPDLPVRFISGGGERMQGVSSTKATIINVCGPTECTDDYTSYSIAPGLKIKDIPIGRPMYNTWVFVVDGNGSLVPSGAVGEICVAGIQVAEGYWKNEQLTAQKFSPCRFVEKDYFGRDVRMFHTGDFGRWNSDGQLMFVGRRDLQVKVNGYRIEIGEVESCLSTMPEVISVCVKDKTFNGRNMLVAYYTSWVELPPERIKEFLRGKLPHYMVPEKYMRISNIPLTINGKTDYGALPEFSAEQRDGMDVLSPIETLISEVISDCLNVSIGKNENLISYGMSSIDAMRISVKLYNKGVKISPTEILSAPFISEIARLSVIDKTDNTISITKAEEISLMDNQRALLVDWEKDKSAIHYNVPFVLHFKNVSVDKLISAVMEIVEIHPALKTRIKYQNGVACMYFADDKFEIICKRLDKKPKGDFFRRQIHPFDIDGGPLFESKIFKYLDEIYLYVDIHHIIFDGYSKQIFLRDMLSAIEGRPLAKEQLDFISYAAQSGCVSEEQYNNARSFYSRAVGDGCSYTYPASGEKTIMTRHVNQVYRSHLQKLGITDYCREYSMTLSTFSMSVFLLALHRLMQKEKIAIAVIVSGRDEIETNNTIGMFVKTLPIVSCLGKDSGTVRFHQFVDRVSSFLSSACSYSYYSFARLAEDFSIKPDIMFVYEEIPYDLSLNGGNLECTGLVTTESKTPLVLRTYPEGDSLCYEFEYDSSIYERAEIKTLANTMAQLSLSVCNGSAAAPVSCLPLIDTDTGDNIIRHGKGKFSKPSFLTPIDKLMAYARLIPDGVAVIDSEGEYTYKELDCLSDRTACYIVNKHEQCGPFIGVSIGRRKEYVLTIFSVLRSGKAFIPLDASLPPKRLEAIITDSDLKVVITSRKDVFTLSEITSNVNIVFIEDMLAENEGIKSIDFSEPENLAYMIYTSGTSGVPKGVPILTSSLMSFVSSMARIYRLSENSRIACFSSFAFDASIEDIFPVLSVGGTSVIIPEECTRDMNKLHDFVLEKHATGGSFPTQFGQMFLKKFALPQYEFVAIGGEKMLEIPNFAGRLFNTYGPTESTVITSYFEIDKSRDYIDIPIGYPIDNSIVYIVDENMQLLPAGIVGELCVSGPQLSKGYWRRPDLNDSKFIPNPFNSDVSDSYSVLFRTGDLCRWNNKWEIEYVGRKDTQVKLRGYRIELSEINRNLVCLDYITSAYAVLKKSTNSYICVFYTANQDVDSGVLRHYLAQVLPEYMVPDVYVRIDRIPLTLSGKVDENALMKELPAEKEKSITILPATEVETLLCRLMTEILGDCEIGPDDDFVACGGNSLNILRLQEEFNSVQQGKSVLNFNLIFKYRSPRRIACNLLSQSRLVVPQKNLAPLSEMQRMHFDTCMDRKNEPVFNVPVLLNLSAETDIYRLKSAVEVVVKNHSIFSTKIVMNKNGEPCQVQNPEWHFAADMKFMNDNDFMKEKEKLIKPFRLLEDELIRVSFIVTNKTRYLFVDIHHIIFDGESSKIFFREVCDAYYGKRLKNEASNYLQYVLEEKDFQSSVAQTDMLSWYRTNMFNVSKNIFPRKDKNVISEISENANFTIASDYTKMMSVVNNCGVSLNALLTAAFGLFLHIDNQRINKLALVNAFNGRADSRYDETIGVFSYPMFVAIDLEDKELRVDEYLKAVNANILQSMSSCHISMSALSDIEINLRDYMQFIFHGEIETFDNTLISPVELTKHKSSSGLPMTAHMSTKGDKLFLRLRYMTGLYSKERVEEIARVIQKIIDLMCIRESISEIVEELY